MVSCKVHRLSDLLPAIGLPCCALMLGLLAPTPALPQTGATTLTVVTFNAEWLFDGVDDGARSPWRNDAQGATQHMQEVAAVVRSIDADIVNLVEVENLEVLERLNADFLQGMGYTAYLVNGRDNYTGQDVGLLSRHALTVPLARTEDRADYPVPESTIDAAYDGSSGVSKHYYTVLSIGDMQLALIGVHFVAFPQHRERCLQREAQAEVIRRIAKSEGLDRGYEVIVLGDFNDYDTFGDAAGSQPISVVLPLLKNADRSAAGEELVNVAHRIPVSERYSAWWDSDEDDVFEIERGEATMIDHVLVSRGLDAVVDDVWFDRSYAPGTVSDHWPLVVRFNLGDGAPPPVAAAAVHTGVVVSNVLGEVRPFDAGNRFFLMLSTGTYRVLSSLSGDPVAHLDLRDWLGRRVSVQGSMEGEAIYGARLPGAP